MLPLASSATPVGLGIAICSATELNGACPATVLMVLFCWARPFTAVKNNKQLSANIAQNGRDCIRRSALRSLRRETPGLRTKLFVYIAPPKNFLGTSFNSPKRYAGLCCRLVQFAVK